MFNKNHQAHTKENDRENNKTIKMLLYKIPHFNPLWGAYWSGQLLPLQGLEGFNSVSARE